MPLKIQFYDSALDGALNERADSNSSSKLSELAQRDLQRYYDMLALALATVDLTVGEAALIVDAMNGTLIDLHAAQMLHYEISDSYEDGLAEKWDVDRVALQIKINDWSLLQRMAVCDAVERFWSNSYHVDNTQARLVRVGLVRGPEA